jgi:chromosome segregation ATPase
MSVEDRVLRLENAFATMSELAAGLQSRTDTLAELAAKSESRTDNLAQMMNSLVQLAVSASERADTHESWINALGSQAEELAAAQVELTKAQARTESSLAETNERLAETNERLNSLINVVERFISERHGGES